MITTAPLEFVFLHSLRITVFWISRSPGAGGAVVGGGGKPPSDDKVSCPLGFGYISYLPSNSFPGVLSPPGHERMPCLGFPVTIILLVSTALGLGIDRALGSESPKALAFYGVAATLPTI